MSSGLLYLDSHGLLFYPSYMLHAMFTYLIPLYDDSCEIYTITSVHDIKLAPATVLLSPNLACFPKAGLFQRLEALGSSQEG